MTVSKIDPKEFEKLKLSMGETLAETLSFDNAEVIYITSNLSGNMTAPNGNNKMYKTPNFEFPKECFNNLQEMMHCILVCVAVKLKPKTEEKKNE